MNSTAFSGRFHSKKGCIGGPGKDVPHIFAASFLKNRFTACEPITWMACMLGASNN